MVVICTVLFIPESPRWQIANGKEAEARAFLVKYHGNGDEGSTLVALQIQEFTEHIATDGADKRWWDCKLTTEEAWWLLTGQRETAFQDAQL